MKIGNKEPIPRNVMFLSLVSLFNDIASEMIYPIVPIFLTTVLKAPVSVVGLIEGVAEATASFMKFFSGYWSDRIQKRKPFVVAGYGLGAVSKFLTATAYIWPSVLFARFIDRLGKGIRTSARDSLLLQNTTKTNKGFIFGFHRSVDSLGAVIGPLLALLLMQLFRENIRAIFMAAFVPALIGLLLLVIFVKEKKIQKNSLDTVNIKPKKMKVAWRTIHPSLKLFFIISLVFALGNSSDAFLILRSENLGLSTTLVVLAYVLYNIVQTLFATPAGMLADRIGAKRVFAIGLAVFAVVYASFGVINGTFWVWFLFPVYGIYIAFTDGVSKAYISQFISERESGTFFGIYQMGTAICQFLASFIGGLLWSRVSPQATFLYGSFMAVAALSLLAYGRISRKLL